MFLNFAKGEAWLEPAKIHQDKIFFFFLLQKTEEE